MKLTTAGAVLIGSAHVSQAATQMEDTFERPNADIECPSDELDFMAYGASLNLTCEEDVCEYKVRSGY